VAETAWFTYDDFADRVGDEFRVRTGPEGPEVALVLSEVTVGSDPSGTGPEGVQRQQFSLTFRCPSGHQLSQGTWELEHVAMGELALFLVPIGPDAEGPRFEAAFS
jgi:hypothetical protein